MIPTPEQVIPSTQDPVLPYGITNPSSGYSGTDTSAERARTEDRDGTTAYRQRQVRELLYARGEHGITVKELRELTGWHHGQASAALSNLHKVQAISRLSERRDRCKVYVSNEYVNGREIEAQAIQARRFTIAEVESVLRERGLADWAINLVREMLAAQVFEEALPAEVESP